MATIDLNADVGEGVGDDAALIPLVTSVNVCGGAYAGSRSTIAAAIELAVEHGVTVGAHPGYPDRDHFGRRPLALDGDALLHAVAEQLALVAELSRAAGTRVAYVKPHGALYHAVTTDEAIAATVDGAIAAVDPALALLLAPGAVQAEIAAQRGARAYAEGFADRGYAVAERPDLHAMTRRSRRSAQSRLTLASRDLAGATLAPHAAAEQARRLAVEHEVADLAGTTHQLTVDSICLHGDAPGAADAAAAIRAALGDAGVALAPFAASSERHRP